MTDTTNDDSVVIERIVDASVDRVWRMWTDPALFAEWYGPDGATVHVTTMDLSVGGAAGAHGCRDPQRHAPDVVRG